MFDMIFFQRVLTFANHLNASPDENASVVQGKIIQEARQADL